MVTNHLLLEKCTQRNASQNLLTGLNNVYMKQSKNFTYAVRKLKVIMVHLKTVICHKWFAQF